MLRGLIVALLAVVSCGLARADVVVLRDGRRLEGTIVEETATKIVLDAVISNIRHTMTLYKNDVQSVTRSPVPEGFFGETPGTTSDLDSPAPGRSEPADISYYLEVPLTGAFGVDFDETGIIEVLDHARRRGITDILFVLDSPGGFVETADRVARALAGHAESLTYHCRVKRAYSASLWVMANCHRLYVDDDGVAGAAVVFRHDRKTGSVEVDAKLLSANVADLVAASARAGALHPLVIRAMMVKEATLHAVREGGGPWTLVEHHDGPPSEDHRVLDTRDTVLSLTGQEFVELGLAEPWQGRSGLTEDSSKRVSNFGQMAMNRSKARAADLERVRTLAGHLAETLEQARTVRSADSFSDYRYETEWYWNGNSYESERRLSAESARLMQTRRALHQSAWSPIAAGATEAIQLIHKHKQSPLPSGFDDLELALSAIGREASAQLR